jgi:hypothetical protein
VLGHVVSEGQGVRGRLSRGGPILGGAGGACSTFYPDM